MTDRFEEIVLIEKNNQSTWTLRPFNNLEIEISSKFINYLNIHTNLIDNAIFEFLFIKLIGIIKLLRQYLNQFSDEISTIDYSYNINFGRRIASQYCSTLPIIFCNQYINIFEFFKNYTRFD